MRLFDFTELIERFGIDPSTARLVRHDRRGAAEWYAGAELWGHFITYQTAANDPFARAKVAFQFIPGPRLPDGDHTALFVGAHLVGESWLHGSTDRLPPMHSDRSRYKRSAGDRAYDLTPHPDFEDLAERVVIRWGPAAATRAWSQWAHTQRKEIVELRRTADEPAFPGFAAFSATLEDIALMPSAWRSALASVGGVYLLVCPETGEQYVGSAYGDAGFWRRWSAYAADGHGGNKLLMARPRANYAIAVLEVASPDMAPSEIIAREAAWKVKLGSRAHGLNAN